MRKNSIRKLIHGILDLLPLFVIPIFAININQKSVEPISIEVQEQMSVDFNQIVDLSKVNTVNATGFTHTGVQTISNGYQVTATSNNTSTFQYYLRYTSTNLNLQLNHKYLISCNFQTDATNNYYVFRCFPINNPNYTAVTSNSFIHIQNIITCNSTSGTYELGIINSQTLTNLNGSTITIKDIMITDLTKMYGSGNEPTINQFNNEFPNVYYTYTESEKMLVNKSSPTTYNDTDIGSQFLYSLYISTDNYFNMNNVFNLNGVYSWFEMNIFGGSAPLSIYIVWNIIIYELVMDLLMLLYALFMFFIDACQKLIDKPLESIK